MSTIAAITPQEKAEQRKSFIKSAVIHLILFILAVLPLLTYPDPPPGQAGVLVSFGEPDAGENGGDTPTAPPIAEHSEETKPEKEASKAEDKPVAETEKKAVIDEKSRERAIQKQKKKEKERAERKKREAERKKQREAQEKKDRIAKAKAEAQRIAREKAAAAAEAKRLEADKFRNLGRNAGSNSGGGDGNKPGTQGQQDGDPSGEALEGISTGSGVLGGGIAGRKIVKKPSISDRSQKVGTVNVKICVDSEGNVSSAEYTQSGSTSSDPTLIRKAIEGAKKYKFNSTDRELQCGTMKINFRLQ